MVRAKHTEIREWIESEIRHGRFPVGTKLPTEKELMEWFGVSRNPVQAAMSKLVESGIVVRRRGAGSVVASSGLRSNLLRHLDESLAEPEVAGAHRVINVRVATAGSFQLSTGVLVTETPSAELARVKFGNTSEPIAMERCVIDLSQVPNILDQDLESLTTIAYYNSIGITVRQATSVLSAVHLPAGDAAEIGVTETTPVVRQLRTIFSANEYPIEIAEFLFHPTNMTLEVSQIERV